jgi:hypothetical protein
VLTITGTAPTVHAGVAGLVIPRHPVVTLTGNTAVAALTGNSSAVALTAHDWRTQLVSSNSGAALTPNQTEANLT